MALSDILNLEKETAAAYDPRSGERAFGDTLLKIVLGEIDRRRKLKETEASQEFQIKKLEAIFGSREKIAGMKMGKSSELTPYQQHLEKYREWLMAQKEKTKEDKTLSNTLQLVSKNLSLAKSYELTDAELSESYQKLAEKNMAEATKYAGEKKLVPNNFIIDQIEEIEPGWLGSKFGRIKVIKEKIIPKGTKIKSPFPDYPDAFQENGIWKVMRGGKKYRIEE